MNEPVQLITERNSTAMKVDMLKGGLIAFGYTQEPHACIVQKGDTVRVPGLGDAVVVDVSEGAAKRRVLAVTSSPAH